MEGQMPQASEEQRQEWGEDGGAGEGKAIAYLKAAGYTLLPNWFWRKPSPEHKPTEKELGAIWFLIDEWDFGGIEPRGGFK
jgi:hypothetical protein